MRTIAVAFAGSRTSMSEGGQHFAAARSPARHPPEATRVAALTKRWAGVKSTGQRAGRTIGLVMIRAPKIRSRFYF